MSPALRWLALDTSTSSVTLPCTIVSLRGQPRGVENVVCVGKLVGWDAAGWEEQGVVLLGFAGVVGREGRERQGREEVKP